MKKILLFILSLVIGIALFIGVLYYIGLDDLKSAFTSFSWATIAVVVALTFLQIFIIIYRWQLILAAQGDKLPLKKLLAPKFVGFAVSYLTPGLYVGGEPVRAYLLKRNTGVRLSHGFASIIVDKILDFTYPLPFLIGALIYAMFKYDISWEAVSALVLVLLGLIVLLGFFYVQTYRGKGFFSSLIIFLRLNRIRFIKKYFEKILYFEGMIITFFNSQPALFTKGLSLSLLGGIVVFIQFIVILHALGIQADIVQILVMMVFMILAFLVPLPASLGSFEASQVIVFSALGHPASIGVAFVLIFRMAELGKLAVGLSFLLNIGLKFLRSIPKNGNNNNHS
jgi:uncharacterized protein (TIRG00374 family)